MFRMRYAIAFGMLVGGAGAAQPVAQPAAAPFTGLRGTAETLPSQGDLSVLTYNVKGLPWPIAADRTPALRQIGARLAGLRSQGRQPGIVVLEEAFSNEAKAIAERAGYAFHVEGPYGRAHPGNGADGVWYRGETQSAMLDSGLAILSDYPVLSADRAAFPQGACAGYDCLAAKGVLLVTVSVPGKGPIAVAATHFNSRKASGAPYARTHMAYAKQAAFVAEFLDARLDAGMPLVLAGDFNRGQRPARIASLSAMLRHIGGAGGAREALRERMAEDPTGLGGSPEASWIRRKARDMQFVFDGDRLRLDPVGADIPFGSEQGGAMLSDHMGFTIHYRVWGSDRAA
jgi:endonuclease/exonuclease/phosphatase family metal-dependent hydrolase